MMAVDIADQLPEQSDVKFNPQLPHTRASFKIQDIIPKSHLDGYEFTEEDMQLIRADELEETASMKEARRRKKLSTLFKNSK